MNFVDTIIELDRDQILEIDRQSRKNVKTEMIKTR